MPQYHAPLEDFRFLLQDYLAIGQYAGQIPAFAEAGPDLIGPVLEEAAKLCQEVLFPLNQSGDAEGLTLADGVVKTPKGFKEAYRRYIEGGWTGFTCDPEHGGQGLPEVLNLPMMEMVCSANLAFGLTPGLSHGAYSLLAQHADETLKKTYLPKLVAGEWSGVMCLTEPQAGTDLGLIRTRAEVAADGSYRLSGTKIFISSGEQDLTGNILHLVLARLPDAPAGTRGISLFLVPKILVNEDGSPGARNGVRCEGLEHKMGLHASPTCVLHYDNAVGFLVGKPHRGLAAMFTMMNAARLYVGVQGLGIAEVAMQQAVLYAAERLQGRHVDGAKMPEQPADPIAVHADVQRMLLTMRSLTEGCRALAMETALMSDLARRHPDASQRQDADDFVQLVTPILKSFLTDTGFEVANLAVQVHGGYGYIRDYGVEQYVRDIRIAQIYEGTNFVQAADLVGRKLPFATGRYLRAFFHRADAFLIAELSNQALAEFTKPFAKHLEYLRQATLWIAKAGMTRRDDAMAGAVEYQRLFALVMLGWIWMRQAKLALELEEKNPEFFARKLQCARFYFAKILPQGLALLASLTAGARCLEDR